MAAGAHEDITDIADKGDALEQCGETNIEAHVTVENMTELMRNHPLQLIALQVGDGPPGDADHRIRRCKPGGKGVDAALGVQHKHRRYWHAGGQGDLVDDVEAAALGAVGGLRQYPGAAHGFGDDFTAGGQLQPFDGCYQAHGSGNAEADGAKTLRAEIAQKVPEAAAAARVEVVVVAPPEKAGKHRVGQYNQRGHRAQE